MLPRRKIFWTHDKNINLRQIIYYWKHYQKYFFIAVLRYSDFLSLISNLPVYYHLCAFYLWNIWRRRKMYPEMCISSSSSSSKIYSFLRCLHFCLCAFRSLLSTHNKHYKKMPRRRLPHHILIIYLLRYQKHASFRSI